MLVFQAFLDEFKILAGHDCLVLRSWFKELKDFGFGPTALQGWMLRKLIPMQQVVHAVGGVGAFKVLGIALQNSINEFC